MLEQTATSNVYGYHARNAERIENEKVNARISDAFAELEMVSHFIFEQMSADLLNIEGRVK